MQSTSSLTWPHWRKYGGAGFAVGGIMTMLLTNAAEAAYNGFSVRYDAISGLGGAGAPTEVFWNAQLLVSGVLWLAMLLCAVPRDG